MAFRRLRRSFGRSMPPAAEAELGHARRLIQAGRYGAAGELLTEMARRSAMMDGPQAAAELHTRAAHCYVAAGMEVAALNAARAALRLFGDLGMPERSQRFLENITRKFDARGMPASAEALRSAYAGSAALAPAPATAPVVQPAPRHLPPSCPQCGAPLRSDEVDWVDAQSAECAYCGGIVSI